MGSVVIGNFAKSRMAENDLAAEAVGSPNLIDERVGERLRRRRVSLGHYPHASWLTPLKSTVQQVRQWEDGNQPNRGDPTAKARPNSGREFVVLFRGGTSGGTRIGAQLTDASSLQSILVSVAPLRESGAS